MHKRHTLVISAKLAEIETAHEPMPRRVCSSLASLLSWTRLAVVADMAASCTATFCGRVYALLYLLSTLRRV